MKINIVLEANADDIALQVFDTWYAYQQSESTRQDMKIDLDIVQNNELLSGHTNILLATMPERVPNNIDKFDIIFFANMFESCALATQTIVDNLHRPNAYFLNGSTLVDNHPWKNKFLNPQCNIPWVKEFFRLCYPGHYQLLKGQGSSHTVPMVLINGAKRAHRHWFATLLNQQCPTIVQRAPLGQDILITEDAFFESSDDTQFRQFVNETFEDQLCTDSQLSDYNYYQQRISVGINGKFGQVPPGLFILPEFWQSDCVIFPESSWINDTLHISEKSVKCFFTGSFPWPIAGSNTNSLYNSLGFYTAWNLLPDDLQEFDSIKDHQLRHTMQVKCLEWASRNPHIFSTDQAKEMLMANYLNLHCFKPIIDGMKSLTDIITKHERRH